MRVARIVLICAFGLLAASAANAESKKPHAFLVAEVGVKDADAYKTYASRVQSTLDPYGGKFVAKGGQTETLEGASPAGGVVIIEFPSMQDARQFWDSPAYREILPIRLKSATSRIYLTEGLPSK